MTVSKKTKISFLIIVLIAFLAALLSFFVYKANVKGSQKTFVFPSVEEGRFIIERRNIPKSYIEPVEYYVNEILLGPQTERTERLFPKETEVLCCFQRDKVLYVDFSKDILKTDNKMLPIKDSIELFKKNILKNFHSISKVKVFVEGNLAFDGN